MKLNIEYIEKGKKYLMGQRIFDEFNNCFNVKTIFELDEKIFESCIHLCNAEPNQKSEKLLYFLGKL